MADESVAKLQLHKLSSKDCCFVCLQVQMYALGSLFQQKKAGQQALLPMACVLDYVMPAFCRGIFQLLHAHMQIA